MSEVPTPKSVQDQQAHGDADEASRRQLQMFADAVAHDLRAPLRSIQNFSRLLETRVAAELDETANDHLQRIRRAAERMDGLLAGLGELSQATSAALRPGPVDLGMLCDWVLAELQDGSPGRSVEITTDGLDRLQVQGDERLLKLALSRLMDNAWRFTPADETVRVEVSATTTDGRVRLQVRDHGGGFDMRYVHKIFEPFQRLHGPEEGAGHGLGLAVAQRIVERHGGTLSAESGDGGTIFHLELPATA